MEERAQEGKREWGPQNSATLGAGNTQTSPITSIYFFSNWYFFFFFGVHIS